MRHLLTSSALFITLLLTAPASAQPILYVDKDAPGRDDGSNWVHAYRSLQDALGRANEPNGVVTEIRVAQGIYTPDKGANQTPGDREATFQLINGVAIKGGYAGFGEPDPDERDIAGYETILSGDLNGDDGPEFENNDENSYHVVTGSDTDHSAVLEGFTITAGNDDRPWPDGDGAGMFNERGSPTLIRCAFVGNMADGVGGGMYNLVNSSPTLANCTFTGNSSKRSSGGGMLNFAYSSPTLTNCTFTGNTASFGAGVYNEENSSPVFTNCTFSANSARRDTGGMYVGYRCYPALVNCIFWGNSDRAGTSESAQIRAELGSPEVMYSCIQGLDRLSGRGNMGLNPLFADANGSDGIAGTEDDDLRLLPASPCIDAGDNQAVPPDALDLNGNGNTTEPMPIDLDGDARFDDDPCAEDTGLGDPNFPDLSIVDMGAYEYLAPATNDMDGDHVPNCADNCPAHPNPNQKDCHRDGMGDVCVLALGLSHDCNDNRKPDECDIASGHSADHDADTIPDECQRIIYVDALAHPGGDGSSWHRAFDSLQDALFTAEASGITGIQLRVAQGTYTPDYGVWETRGDREATFQLLNGVELSGGYAGRSTAHPAERDITAYEAILSGDLNGDDNLEGADNDENSHLVVTGSGTDQSAVLDGVTVTAGNATDDSEHKYGGGIHNERGSPTITNCTIADNFAYSGAGMSNLDDSNPVVTGCTFRGNTATNQGGGMVNRDSDPTVTGCVFTQNRAASGGGMHNIQRVSRVANCVFRANSADHGGAVTNSGGSVTMTNCIFVGNSAGRGGGMHNWRGGNLTLINCTFARNSANGVGGGLDHWGDGISSTLTNCIFWANTDRSGSGELAQIYGGSPVVNYNAIQGWSGALGGVGNIGSDPLFVNADGPDGIPGTEDDNVRLSPDSPCRDVGDSDALPEDVVDLDGDGNQYEPLPLDLDHHARVFNGIVDMGAYEYQLRAMFVTALDIMPETCPNRLKRQGHGPIRVALLGTWSFDVTDVDVDTLVLTRADGADGEVRPIMTPSGLEPRVQDVAMTVGGELCDCHKPRRDGRDDLVLRFATREIIERLRLNSAAPGDSVTLTLAGSLFDGRVFEVSDCVVAVGRNHGNDRNYRKPR